MYNDVNGVCIDTGTVVKHGNKQGIVVDDEFEGQYVVLETGMKLRIKDYYNRLTVVLLASRKGDKHVKRKQRI